MKTIAQQLGITEFPFIIKGKNGKQIYYETSTRYWWKSEYDSNGKQIYYEDCNGFWEKRKYDSNGNEIYYEDCNGFWWKREFDSNGKQIYFENSNGLIIDDKPKPVIELTLDEIANKMGIDVSQIRIKD